MNGAHRLVVVRCDGLVHTSDFSGWHSETAVFHYFNLAKDDKRTILATVFQAGNVDDPKWYARAEHYSRETKS